MPDMDGIDATRRITSDPALEGVKVLVLTTFETDELILAALRAGASAFLGKGVDPKALISAIRTVAAGEQLLSPAATKSLIERVLAEPVRTPAGSYPESTTSQTVNGRSRSSSPRGCRTSRSLSACSSVRLPPRRM